MAKRRDRKTVVVFDGMEFEVETWWDRLSSNWICQIIDEQGSQVGHAHFSYTRPDDLHNAFATVEAVRRHVIQSHWQPKSYFVADSRDSCKGAF